MSSKLLLLLTVLLLVTQADTRGISCPDRFAILGVNMTVADNKTLDDCPGNLVKITDENTGDCMNQGCMLSVKKRLLDETCFKHAVEDHKKIIQTNGIASNPVCMEIIESDGATLDFSNLTHGQNVESCENEMKNLLFAHEHGRPTKVDELLIADCSKMANEKEIPNKKTRDCIERCCKIHYTFWKHHNEGCRPSYMLKVEETFIEEGIDSNQACKQFLGSKGANVNFFGFTTTTEEPTTTAAPDTPDTTTYSSSNPAPFFAVAASFYICVNHIFQ